MKKPYSPPWFARLALRRTLKANPDLVGISYTAIRDIETGEIAEARLESDRLLASLGVQETSCLTTWASYTVDPRERFDLLVALSQQFGMDLEAVGEAMKLYHQELLKREEDTAQLDAPEVTAP